MLPHRLIFTAVTLQIPGPTVHNCCDKEKDATAKCRSGSSQSIADSVGMAVTESKSQYRRLVFDDSKVKLVCLSHAHTVV